MGQVAMVLAPGFEETEAILPADLLRRAGVDLILAGLEGYIVTGSHDISVEVDMTLEELPLELDALILPGGMPGSANLAANDSVMKRVKQMHNDSALVAAICAAPALVLGPSGILEGRRFTCYPAMEKQTSSGIFLEKDVVIDGNIITSRGVGTAGEFGLALVEYLVDSSTAQKLRKATLLG